MRQTYAHDEVPSPRMPSGVVSVHRTIEEQENILNGIFSPDPPFSNLNPNCTRNGLHSITLTTPIDHSPRAHLIPSPNTPHISIPKPLYFVTEPTESPTSPNSSPILDHHIQNNPTISEDFSPSQSPSHMSIGPNPNPLLLPTPEPPYLASVEGSFNSKPQPKLPSLDQTLATVFTHLAIKRKPNEEAEDCQRSKLLRLCAPIPVPNPITPATQPPNNLPFKPKPIRTRRNYKRGVPRTRASRAGDVSQASFDSKSGLCDVPVQQSLSRVEAELFLVPTNMAAPSEIDGSVAGPKQPPAQC